MNGLLLMVLGALCSWPLQRLVLQLPADLLDTPAPEPRWQKPRPMLIVCNALLWGGCGWHWPTLETAMCWAIFASTLLTLSIIDWQTTLLPDALTQPLLWLGVLSSALQLTHLDLAQAVWGAAWGYGALWLVATVFSRLTGQEGMGAGDFKLLAAMGAWLGPWALLPLVFLASLVGACVGIWLKSRRQLRHGVYVPFGPFSAGAGMLLAVSGDAFFFNWLTG